MAPFLGALAIILLVVIGIVAFSVFGGSDTTPDQQLRGAVVGQNDALQRQDYGDFRDFTCRAEQRNEADVLAGQRDSLAKGGERYVDEVSDLRITGDRASVKVTYHFKTTPNTTSSAEVTLLREDGAWKVCSR
ncbi:MAG: hypothetical protein QOJ80_2594 [Mycobacterium sp.]|jgi:hypothetical protein|nr:hypothetical protein [Mycobacterium sp.]